MKYDQSQMNVDIDYLGNKMRSYTCKKCKTKIRSMVIGKNSYICAKCQNDSDGVNDVGQN